KARWSFLRHRELVGRQLEQEVVPATRTRPLRWLRARHAGFDHVARDREDRQRVVEVPRDRVVAPPATPPDGASLRVTGAQDHSAAYAWLPRREPKLSSTTISSFSSEYAPSPVPAGIRRPMRMFSLRPSR